MAEKDEKKTIATRFRRFFRETLGELRKVSWPTPQEAWQLTKIVLLVMLAMAILLGGLDFVFSEVIASIVA